MIDYAYTVTWIGEQVSRTIIRSLREMLSKWKIWSTLRLSKNGLYTLVVHSQTEKGLRFARTMVETTLASGVLNDEQMVAMMQQAIETAEPPVEHLK